MKSSCSSWCLILTLLLVGNAFSIGELYSEGSEKILKNIKKVIIAFEESIEKLVPHFIDEDKMVKNQNFYTNFFVNDMNRSFDLVENKKAKIYEHIQNALKVSFDLNMKEKSFDLQLENEDQLMMKFVITLDKKMRTAEMKQFWHKALSSKNGMFSSIALLKKSIMECSINLVNFFDNMEAYLNESKNANLTTPTITLKEVKKFKYITGFLQRMKVMYLRQNEIFKEINQNMLSVSQDILEWGKHFTNLKGYMEDFMAGKIKIEENEEAELEKDLREELALEEELATHGEDNPETEIEFLPREGEDYKPGSQTQINSKAEKHPKMTDEIDWDDVTDPEELERLKEQKEQEETHELEHLAITRIKEMETQMNKEQMEKESSAAEAGSLAPDAVKTCNKVLLMNYFLEGHVEAITVSDSDPIGACPEIQNTCCTKPEVEKAQRFFIDEMLPKYAKRYYLMRKMVKNLLKNYRKFVELAYDIMKIQGADPICHQSAESIIFTPVGKHFVNTFFKKLEQAHQWLIKAKSSFFCSLCDQRNHHTMFEFNQIIFKREFCQSNIDNTFDFVSIWYMNIADFFNTLINLFQCDKLYGKYSEEVELEKFGMGPRGKQIIKSCIKNERSFCVEYCSEFMFSDTTSFYDISLSRLKSFYDFVLFRVNDYYNIMMKSTIDPELFHLIDDSVITERFTEGYIRMDTPSKIYSAKFEDVNAENPIIYGVDDDAINEAIYSK